MTIGPDDYHAAKKTAAEEIREVLEAHPIVDGDGWYVGTKVCDGCHLVLGDPLGHLAKAVAEALNPSMPSSSRQETHRSDPRESQITWEQGETA